MILRKTSLASAVCLICLAILLPALLFGCSSPAPKTQPPAPKAGEAVKTPGKVTFAYDLKRIPRIASNQVAVWIEDSNGNYVGSVYASNFTAKGGYKNRPDSLAEWVKSSNWKDAPRVEIDAVAGATQAAGRVSLTWPCTDKSGKAIAPGTYVYKIEGNLFWENRVLYRGEITVGTSASSSSPKVQYIPEKAREIGELVTNVSVEFKPN